MLYQGIREPKANRKDVHLSIYAFLRFYIGVSLINNIVLVLGVQQSDSVIHIQVSILFQIFFPFRFITEYWAEFPVLYNRSLLVIYFKYSSTFAATWMDLEIIILNEVSQAEKDKYHMISLICRILKNDTNELIYGYQRGYKGRDKLGVWD